MFRTNWQAYFIHFAHLNKLIYPRLCLVTVSSVDQRREQMDSVVNDDFTLKKLVYSELKTSTFNTNSPIYLGRNAQKTLRAQSCNVVYGIYLADFRKVGGC